MRRPECAVFLELERCCRVKRRQRKRLRETVRKIVVVVRESVRSVDWKKARTYKMASGDNVDVIEVVETSFTGPVQTTEDHLRPEQYADEDSE